MTQLMSKVNRLSLFPYQFGLITTVSGKTKVLAWKPVGRTFGAHLTRMNCMLLQFTQYNSSLSGCGDTLPSLSLPLPFWSVCLPLPDFPSEPSRLAWSLHGCKQKELYFSDLSKGPSSIWWVHCLHWPSFPKGLSSQSEYFASL